MRTNIEARSLLRFLPLERVNRTRGPSVHPVVPKGSILSYAAVRNCYLPSDHDQTTSAELQGFSSVRKYVARQFQDALQGPVIPCSWDDGHDVSLVRVFEAMEEACGLDISSLEPKSQAALAEVEDSPMPGIKVRTGNAPSELWTDNDYGGKGHSLL